MATDFESTESAQSPPNETACAANFEQTLARLEEIVRLLEDGKITLDEALGRYEEGVGLLRKAYDTLERAERRITLLTGIDSEGNPILRPMQDAASFSSLGEGGAAASRKKAGSRRVRKTVEPGQDM